MRLIDAEILKSQLYESILVNEDMDCLDFLRVASLIDAQQRAYDIDEVISELEKLADESYKAYCITFNSDDRAEYDAYINAIEIVKQGAIE